MRHLPTLFLTLAALTACTQEPVMVEYRGNQDHGRGSSTDRYATVQAVPVQPIIATNSYVGATPVYNAERAAVSQTVSTAPIQNANSGAIAMNDLQPAAGTPAPKHTFQAQLQANASKPVELKQAPETKTIEVASNDAAPVNSWTKKPRDAASFNTETSNAKSITPAASNAKQNYIWPVASNDIRTGFGDKTAGKANDGINIASTQGEPVWAAADGEVIYSDNKMKGYGNMVIVKHAGNKTTTYAHLARSGVEKYDRVKQGDIIGYVGTTGSVKKPQLYFSMRDGTTAIDPQKHIDRKVAGL